MALVEHLAWEHVDIVGDVHGEIDSLHALLDRLGCDPVRLRSERPLVFVGDLVDRGPDSVAVVALVQRLVEAGLAKMVLGNHELNLLFGEHKEGNGWYFGHDDGWHDAGRLIPFPSRAANDLERARIAAFFATLPLVLEAPWLRVVHAAWGDADVEAARRATDLAALRTGHRVDPAAFALDGVPTKDQLHDPRAAVAFHAGLAAFQLAKQNAFSHKVLTSGYERVISEPPRFIAGQWRMLERDPWWSRYDDRTPVVFGHYWRRRPGCHDVPGKADPFATDDALAWLGPAGRAFCIDYSVGYRFKARHRGDDHRRDYALAALRWPERLVYFDDRDEPLPTTS